MLLVFLLTSVKFVSTYAIHLLGTYITILCNWLILWQNALYLYLDRSRICLILQETVFQDQVLKTCKSVRDSSWRSVVHKSSTAISTTSYPSSLRSYSSPEARQTTICRALWKIEFQFCFDSNPWLCVWTVFSSNPRHIKGLF